MASDAPITLKVSRANQFLMPDLRGLLYGDALALKHCHGFERTIVKGVTYSFHEHLDVPTTIAWGTRDLILPYSSSAIAQERLPEARHVALPHCGHVPMIDDPALIVRVVQNTTAEVHAAGAAVA